ncbi:hypothetical protein COLO4_13237 [Corchorus olitorius]|uniref:Uncharacterized protein n=1 Tax=Corchorus olitorius TaxID=93759 RepID=A0A1R3JXF2_9ROSI|nr:hypothetical protein COLO4_13237 [Corchorus olitorius]
MIRVDLISKKCSMIRVDLISIKLISFQEVFVDQS